MPPSILILLVLGNLSNKRKRSIYAEYSDLSDFDDYVNADMNYGGENNDGGNNISLENNGTDSKYDGVFTCIDKEKLLNSDDSARDLEFLDYGKDIMRLLSMCHSELRGFLSSKTLNHLCILDLPECGESYASATRQGNDNEYTKMLRNGFFGLRYELLSAFLALFECARSSLKSDMYSQVLRNDATTTTMTGINMGPRPFTIY